MRHARQDAPTIAELCPINGKLTLFGVKLACCQLLQPKTTDASQDDEKQLQASKFDKDAAFGLQNTGVLCLVL